MVVTHAMGSQADVENAASASDPPAAGRSKVERDGNNRPSALGTGSGPASVDSAAGGGRAFYAWLWPETPDTNPLRSTGCIRPQWHLPLAARELRPREAAPHPPASTPPAHGVRLGRSRHPRALGAGYRPRSDCDRRALGSRHQPHSACRIRPAQFAADFRSAALFESITVMRSFQDLTKDFAPSS